jgi:hypothetical protein
LIQLANGFQSLLHLAIPLERLANLRDLLGAKTELTRLGSGVVDVEYPKRVAFAAGALGAAAGVM